MADQRRSSLQEILGSPKSLTAILMLALASMFPSWVLDRTRPPAQPLPFDPLSEAQSGESVRARLWQDPLAAAYRDARSREADRKDDTKEGNDVHEKRRTGLHALLDERVPAELSATASGPEILILPVVVEGGSNPSARETRLRHRYAVVSALGSAGYVPEDGQRIGYDYPRWKLPGAESVPGDETRPIPEATPIPYEFFKRSSGPGPWTCVLVLWVDGDALRLFPAEKLLAIAWSLVADGHPAKAGETESDCLLAGRVELRYLLTTGSSDLIGILRDLKRLAGSAYLEGALQAVHPFAPDEYGRRWSMYASSATVPDATIEKAVPLEVLDPAKRKGSGEPWVHSEFDQPNLEGCIVRTIGDDDVLVESLRSEIETRCDPPYRIAILAEWDTDYGRAWKRAFVEAFDGEFEDGRCGCADCEYPAEKCRCSERGADSPNRVLAREGGSGEDAESGPCCREERFECDSSSRVVSHYSYLAGIDGRIPGEESPAEQPSDPSRPETFQAYGTERTDYVGRLLERIHADIAESGNPLSAIGILGSDVHDKLFLLSVMRREFPGAVFFTTDLDARYMDPAGFDYLRNLVVVTHYGLDLRRVLQRDIPPFRNNYQAALYHATLNALGDGRAAKFGTKVPRVYEVARGGVIDISPLPTRDDHEPTRPRTTEPVLGMLGSGLYYLLGGILLAGVLTWSVLSGAVPAIRLSPRTSKQVALTGLVFVVTMGAFWFVYFHQATRPDREPFGLLSGVSAWPTEAIRILAAALAIGWQYRVLADLREHLPRIETDLGIRVLAPPEAAEAGASTTQPAVSPWISGKATDTTDMRLGAIRAQSEAADAEPARPARLTPLGMPRLRARGKLTRVVDLFGEFKSMAADRYRRRRALVHLAVFVLLSVCIMHVFGKPSRPIRGSWGRGLDLGVIFLSVISMQWLIFLVLDSGMITSRFIHSLSLDTVVDPERSVYRRTTREKLLKDEYFWAKRRIEAAANLTELVGGFVYYPSIVILLMVLSRLPVFDAWVWSRSLVVVILLSFVITIICYLMMWNSARRLRKQVLTSLHHERGEAFGNEELRQAMDEYAAELRGLSTGAFAPIWEHPLLRAILIPFAGMGGVTLLQLLGRAG